MTGHRMDLGANLWRARFDAASRLTNLPRATFLLCTQNAEFILSLSKACERRFNCALKTLHRERIFNYALKTLRYERAGALHANCCLFGCERVGCLR